MTTIPDAAVGGEGYEVIAPPQRRCRDVRCGGLDCWRDHAATSPRGLGRSLGVAVGAGHEPATISSGTRRRSGAQTRRIDRLSPRTSSAPTCRWCVTALADVAPTVSKAVEAECCDDYELDRYGYIRVDDIVVGRAMRNRWGRGYVVFVAGERANHVFPGRNAIFRSAEEAARARAEEVRG